MARLVRLTAVDPLKIDPKTIPDGKMIAICACGLSQTFPLCDGSHKPARASEQAGTLYVYAPDRKTITETRPDQV
jgi:CDGSH iron-sulfur domain-containing protein 1